MSFPTLLQNCLSIIQAASTDRGSLHPLIVHFPIALLFAAPLFVILGVIFKNSAKLYCSAALILMILGSLTLVFAASTGEIASDFLKLDAKATETLEIHDELAEQGKILFAALTVIFLIYLLFLNPASKTHNVKANAAGLTIFLLVYLYGLLLLLNIAHYGGKLVHHHGVKSTLYSIDKKAHP